MPRVTISRSEAARLAERLDAEVAYQLAADAPATLAAAHGIGVTRLGEGVVTWARELDVLAHNRALGFGLERPLDGATLEAIEAQFVAAGAPRFMLQVSPVAQPETLPELLAARGFTLHNRWVKLSRPTADPPSAPTTLTVESIGPEHADAWSHVLVTGFGLPEGLAPLWATRVGRPGWTHYLAYDGDTPAAGAALYVQEGVAWLGGMATLETFRGRGAQGALIARRLRDAAGHGCDVAVTETAEPTGTRDAPSWRNMKRFGFEELYRRPNWVRTLRPAPAA